MVNTKRFIDTSEESVSKYLKDVRKIDMITADEEIELAKRIQEGDRVATEKLISSNLRFVISIAKEYQNQGLPLPDLISEGNLGLIKAAERFDVSRGNRFISYAVWWIRQSILQSLNDHSRTVRLPVNITNQMMKVKKEIEKFEQDNHRKPNHTDIDMTIINQPTCTSLNEVINEDGDELIEMLEDKSNTRPDDDVHTQETLQQELNKSLSILSDREREILEMYFGTTGQAMTLEQIGDEFGLTKERIRQIKEKAVRKVRQNCQNLFEFMYKD
jgi:RNA polymerase primary sigma factor